MATTSNGEVPLVNGDGLEPTALVTGPTIVNAAAAAAGTVVADVAPLVAGPTIVNAAAAAAGTIVADVAPLVAGRSVANMAVALAQPINILNFAGGVDGFDIVEAGLLGSPPRKSNIGYHIHTKIQL